MERETNTEEPAAIPIVLYLCDGKYPSCTRMHCHYTAGGECKHTPDVRHAKNFTLGIGNGNRVYVERE